MRVLSGLLAAGALLLASGTASAAPVATTATLSLNLGILGSFTITGAGSVSLVGTGSLQNTAGTVTGSQIVVGAGLVALPTTVTITIPATQSTLVDSVILKAGLGNAAGTFVSGFAPVASEQCPVATGQACVVGGGVGGVMPIVGNVTAVLLGFIKAQVPLATLNVGVGGTGAAGIIAGEGAPWTTGVGQVFPANGTPATSGSGGAPLTFVSPVFVSALGNALPIFAQYSLSGIQMGVPEPGTLLLLVSGVVGLALCGRRRELE